MGRGHALVYKFDNSKPMGDTIHNSLSNKLNKDELLHLLRFSNQNGEASAQTALDLLWHQLVEKVQSCLKDESDDAVFRVLLPDLNLFVPMMLQNQRLKQQYQNGLMRFVKNLKALVRASNMTVLISVDSNLLDERVQHSLEHLSDTVIKLTSFKEHSELQIGEYDGTI